MYGFEPDETNLRFLNPILSPGIFPTQKRKMPRFGSIMESNSLIPKGACLAGLKQAKGEDDPKTTVTCVRLKDLLDDDIDFLKIDIEGAEYAVLKDCSDDLTNVKNLFVEYHGTYQKCIN